MIRPINRSHPIDVGQVSNRQVSQLPANRKADSQAQTPPVQKSGTVSSDQVTLRRAGETEHDNNPG